MSSVKVSKVLFFNKLLVFLNIVVLISTVAIADQIVDPSLDVSITEKDFGSVNQGVVLETVFEVKNAGKEDLIIRSLNPSCGCTSAVINNPIIKSGDKSQIKFSFNTTGYFGPKVRTLRMYSNDPRNSTVVFKVMANILEPIIVEPKKIDFGEVGREDDLSRTITLRSRGALPLVIKEYFSKSPAFKVELDKGALSEYHFKIKRSDTLPLGEINSTVVFKTDNNLMPVINLPVSLTVHGNIMPSPKEINFGFVRFDSGDENLKRVIRFKNSSSSDRTKIVSVDKSNREIDVSLGEDALGQYIEVTINKLAKGVVRGVIKASTDSTQEDEKIVEIPYFGLVNTE